MWTSSLWLIGLASFLYASSALGSIPGYSQSPYLNPRSARFAVNGTAIPEVKFDVGESYAGTLPVSSALNETKELYFWFFPSNNTNASDEITLWLNGGPGCSSLLGLLQEHGPFVWQPGTAGPRRNQWSWNRLTNIVYIDQPVDTGFSLGKPTAFGEYEVAEQFLGFWKNFIDLFQIKGRKVYVTGESYAGMYVPYIASAMLDKNDTSYYNVEGTMLIDPAINDEVAGVELPMLSYATYWQPLLRLNDTFITKIRQYADDMGYTKFYNEYFTFPRTGHMPIPPNAQERRARLRNMIIDAAKLINPCFNVYHITDTCPVPTDPLPIYDPRPGEPPTYFNRTDVQKAINAPLKSYSVCGGDTFLNKNGTRDGPDNAPRSIFTTLPKVFERAPRNLVVSGALDMILPPNGTLFSLQNATWKGSTGFSQPPTRKLIIPAPTGNFTSPYVPGGFGEMGRWVSERGVTFVEVDLAGHEVPQHNPSAGLRILEVLLGRMDVSTGFGGAGWSIKIGD